MEAESSSVILKVLAFLVLFIGLVGLVVGIYTGKFRRKKLSQISAIEFITSLENVFIGKTQFLVVAGRPARVNLKLLDQNEGELRTLLDEELGVGEHPVHFDPAGLESGKYYLSLESNDTKILRRIHIEKV